MKFCEKLQKLRKEKGYSQEQLADLLDVSRQAVSKWESGLTYPEMDKLLAMCKLFNVTLDDLTNDEVKNFNSIKNQNNFSNLIYTIIEMIEKSILMFKNMDKKRIGKFITDFIILIIILVIVKIPFNYLEHLFRDLFTSLDFAYAPYAIVTFIINVVYFIFFLSILLYFYKTRYLDKWEFKTLKEETLKKENIKEKIVKEEKVKTLKTKNFVLFDFLGSIINICLKIILFFTLIVLCLIFVFFIFGFSLNIILMSKGIVIIGLIIVFGGLLLGTGVFLNLNIAWLFNQKIHYYPLLISFIASLVLFASGGAIFSYEITDYTYVSEAPKTASRANKSYTFDMNDDLVIEDFYSDNYYRNFNFKVNEDLDKEIKYNIYYYSDFLNVKVEEDSNNHISTYLYNNYPLQKFIDLIIKNLHNKTIYDYEKLQTINIVIETSSKNIAILKENFKKYEEEIYNEEIDNYQNKINELIEENDTLRNKEVGYEDKIYELESRIRELEEKINDYKTKIEDLLN